MNRIPKALIDKEWLEHGNLITWWLALWVIGLFILPLLTTPLIMGVFCGLYGLWLAQRVGGSDVVQGTEETTFALPATRSEVLLARLWVTGIPLAIMAIGGMIALAVGLPSFLWSLVVESGFTEWIPSSSLGNWMVWTIAPLSMFAWTFRFASGANTRILANASAFVALFGVGGLLWTVGSSEGINNVVLIFIAFLLVGVSITLILTSFRVYPSKEATSNPESPAVGERLWWIIILASLIVFLLIVVFSHFGYDSKPESFPAPVNPIQEPR